MCPKQRISKVKPGVSKWLLYVLLVAAGSGLTLITVNFSKPSPATSEFEPLPESTAQNFEQQSTDEMKAGEFRFIDNWYMNTRTLFIMDGIWHRMGNPGEIFDTVKRIRHTSELSWYREWNRTAARVESIGDACLDKNHRLSAGEAYLRAANYYLGAEVFLHTNPEDPRIAAAYRKGAGLFINGLKLLKEPVREVRIPYEGTSIRGYFFRSPVAAGKAPTLIFHQGFDAPIESSKFIAEEAIRRGYHCLLFEGPGQGLVIREQKLPFRPDWEKVVTPVINYVIALPGVDPERLILMGNSMGGGFAVRAAAFEHRLKICVVDPGYVNIYNMFRDILTPTLVNLYEQDPKEFNQKLGDITQYDVGIRWGINHAMWVFGVGTPADLFAELTKYNYEKVIDQIQCLMLVMDGAQESWGKGQAKQLYDRLKCPKDYMLFTTENSAAMHCQGGAPALETQRLFDWLDEHI